MWSVLTAPCLVETVVPSISGSRSRCTPSRETSPPLRPSRTQILSISSRNTMPLFSTALIASCTSWSLSSSLSDSSLTRISCESSTVRRRVLVRPPILPKISPIEIAPICAPGMPGISNIGMPPDDCVSISISLSLSSPARSFLRKESRVAALEPAPTSASSTRSSAASCGAGLHVLALALAHLRDRDLDEIADDLLDVAADIADLGEFGGLDLDERRAGELRQPPRDLGLADAGRPDHQDVFRQHFLAQACR